MVSAIWTATVPRAETWQLMSGFFISFLCYVLIMSKAEITPLSVLLMTSVAIRLGMIFIFPQLSDDIYRFYWDGRLIAAGVNPYGVLPADVNINNFFPSEGWLLNALNSPEYFTVYPPVLQVLFWIAAAGNDIQEFNIVLKVLYVLGECAGYYFLSKYLDSKGSDKKKIFWYFLNPLVVIEGIGNLHAEVLMIAVLAIFLFYWRKGKMVLASVFFSIAVSVKLTPLMLIPFLWFSHPKHKITFTVCTLLTSILLFSPVWISGKWISYAESLDLYFRKFEFNASIYYVFRELGVWWKGYNLIALTGPLLGLAAMTLIVWLSWKKRHVLQVTGFSILAWFLYLLLTTTVHPWYILPLLFFSSIHGVSAPILWSALIFLTYISYGIQPFREQMWVVVLEYSLILGYISLTYQDILKKIKSQTV
jgi:alpha-1,6-mannosyltransferase